MAGGVEDGAAIGNAGGVAELQAEAFDAGRQVPGIDPASIDRRLATYRIQPYPIQEGGQERVAAKRLVEPGDARRNQLLARTAVCEGAITLGDCRRERPPSSRLATETASPTDATSWRGDGKLVQLRRPPRLSLGHRPLVGGPNPDPLKVGLDVGELIKRGASEGAGGGQDIDHHDVGRG